jgi:transcriptional regulator with XRE-family HTH domain
MGIRTSPTVCKRRLAMRLRRLRAEAGIRAADVATELGCSPGKISQMETSRVSISVPDAKAMLELYGVTGADRDAIVELARTARLRGWWLPYAGAMDPWFQQYVGLETESSVVRTYQCEHVPSLLQTDDYLRAMAAGELAPCAREKLEALVRLAHSRAEILTGDPAPRFAFVLSEAALCRRVGTRSTMTGQLHRLLELSRRDNVTLQVLPFTSGAHAAMTGAFTLLEFAEETDPDIVYVEHLTGARCIEDAGEVADYRTAFGFLAERALSTPRSAALIRRILKQG